MIDSGAAAVGAGGRLTARDLSVAYGPIRVLDGAAIDLGPATISAVVGPNGAGKSTLLAALVAVVPHRGTVLLDGRPLAASGRGRVAYLPQRVRLPANVTVAEMLGLFGGLAGAADRVALPDVFLPPADRLVGELSGGQARRVALAVALLGAPDLLLLDEPFANLDDDGRDVVIRMLDGHRAGGATVLVASPTEIDLLAFVDAVLVVHDGDIAVSPPTTYLGRLKVTLWVRATLEELGQLVGLRGVERVHAEGDYVGLDCREDRSVELLRGLVAGGVAADRIRIGGPEEPGLRPSSPGATGP